jgi:hypothetical protein
VIRDADGTKIFDRASVAEPTPAEQDRLKMQLQEVQQRLQQEAERVRQLHDQQQTK